MNQRRCDRCMWWEQKGDIPNEGNCHKNPPGVDEMFPWVDGGNWCGSYVYDATKDKEDQK